MENTQIQDQMYADHTNIWSGWHNSRMSYHCASEAVNSIYLYRLINDY